MDTAKLKELVAFLRDAGVAYFKDASVELIFAPQVAGHVVQAHPADVERNLPDVFKKLPGNYSHPSLLKMAKVEQ